jgi:hypothetical protein
MNISVLLMRQDRTLVDLVGLPQVKGELQAAYDGICW